jgi:predicted PurR-regulated permease PerM
VANFDAAGDDAIGLQDLPEPAVVTDRVQRFAQSIRNGFKRITTFDLPEDVWRRGVDWATGAATSLLITGVRSFFSVIIGLVIMVLALYYFLADGPSMIRTAMDLSPLDSHYEQELLQRFGQVSRAVVVATLLSAVVQGSLAGIGYYFALPSGSPIFLLTAATMVAAMIPFVGAAFVWVIVCVWVYVYGDPAAAESGGNWLPALLLAVYSTVVVSGIDNVIKPLVLQGQSNLHPLLALLSILGGVQVLGPVGILVGPMVVSFLQALLSMLQRELDSFSGTGAGFDMLAEPPQLMPEEGPAPAIAPPATTESKSAAPNQRGKVKAKPGASTGRRRRKR